MGLDNIELFTISENQMRVFSAEMLYQFYKKQGKLINSLFEQLNKPTLDKEDLTAFIDYGIKTARMYQLKSENEVKRYLLVMARHGKDFNKESWAHIILNYAEFDTLLDELEEESLKVYELETLK